MNDHHQPDGLARAEADLLTPVYLKLEENATWPADEVFFMLSRDGIHLCRNHRFFRCSVPAPRFPSELAAHEPFLDLRDFPRISQEIVEIAVGFFHEVYCRFGSEAGLLLVWNEMTEQLRLVCPEQRATITKAASGVFPIGLHYTIPDLGRDDLLLGDLHSHADESAYASVTDKTDEQFRTGIHVVVGRLGDVDRRRPPDFHIDVVADGKRFNVLRAETILEGYEAPNRDFPGEWLDRIEVECHSAYPPPCDHHDGTAYGEASHRPRDGSVGSGDAWGGCGDAFGDREMER